MGVPHLHRPVDDYDSAHRHHLGHHIIHHGLHVNQQAACINDVQNLSLPNARIPWRPEIVSPQPSLHTAPAEVLTRPPLHEIPPLTMLKDQITATTVSCFVQIFVLNFALDLALNNVESVCTPLQKQNPPALAPRSSSSHSSSGSSSGSNSSLVRGKCMVSY
ncbi:hypothetical protein BJ878DRAFT_129860 [Calycina marina]|uniref:Uncharacterized protein n=1 Tax=Calycina marina TaxID=1763456 RepID=A0A9P8CI18_9HELO|nr:hypothetical protein BJ878DRAFT_129860 [Calycina marina]